MHVKITPECQIFFWTALGYARHFSSLSVTKAIIQRDPNDPLTSFATKQNKNYWSLIFLGIKQINELFGIDVTD